MPAAQITLRVAVRDQELSATTPAAKMSGERRDVFFAMLSAAAQRRRWISPQATGSSASSGAPRAVIGPGL
jgi:hypothetical protein